VFESISIAPNGRPQWRHFSRKGKLLVRPKAYGLLKRGQGQKVVQRTPKQKRKIEITNRALPKEYITEGGYIFRMIPRIGSIATYEKEIKATALENRSNFQPHMIFVCLLKCSPCVCIEDIRPKNTMM
jgi:hypothetical protein